MPKRSSDLTALCEFLVKKMPVRTIILFGSIARGENTSKSDIDLLVITQQKINKRDIKKLIPKSLIPRKELSLSAYSSEQMGLAYENGSLFMTHLLKEGKILYDDGFFKELASKPFETSISRMKLSLRIFEQRLETINNLEIYDKHFIRLFSDFYSMAKSIAFILLANSGRLVFNRQKAFSILTKKYPDYEQSILKLQELEPFYMKIHRGTLDQYPFKPAISEEKVQEMKIHLKELILLGDLEIAC